MGYLAGQLDYYSYNELKLKVINFKIKNNKEYVKAYKSLNSNTSKAPSCPPKFYKNKGWKGWDAFFNLDDMKTSYYTYTELKCLIKTNKIETCDDYWKNYKKLFTYEKIAPRNPDIFYLGNGWDGWSNFTEKEVDYKRKKLKERRKKNFCTYNELKKIIIENKILSKREYRNNYKGFEIKYNCLIPGDPEYIYLNNGWINWDTFCEKPKLKQKTKYVKYDDLKKIVKNETIQNKYEYVKFANTFNNKSDLKAPIKPDSVYSKNGWAGWDSFLGTTMRYFTYVELSKILIEKNVKYCEEYYKIYKEIKGENGLIAPKYPQKTYINEWINWSVFLNNENLYYTYEELKGVLIKHKIMSSGDYRRRYRTLEDANGKKAPNKPFNYYKGNGWIDWYDIIPEEAYFFDTNNTKINKNNSRSISIGEFEIMKFLDDNKIEYKYNRPIEGCFHKKALLFDFQLIHKKVCIEYDGKQHFQPIDYFGGEKSFKTTKTRDSIKNKFCEENNIKMIRIPYSLSKKEILEILEKELLN